MLKIQGPQNLDLWGYKIHSGRTQTCGAEIDCHGATQTGVRVGKPGFTESKRSASFKSVTFSAHMS